MKFAALNKQSSSNADSSSLSTPSSKRGKPTKEAQESACLQLYHKAIKHQQDGQLEEAKALYHEILESQVMEEEGEAALAVGRSVQTSTILKLKYLIYKNLASIARDQGDLSAAVDAYIQASSVDTTDITMWCQLGSAASSLGNLLMARTALEQALQCNERYWPALESLCTVLFALQDFGSCIQAVARGLEMEPNFPRGIAYLHRIFKECPDFAYQFPQLRVHLMKPCKPEYEKYFAEAAELKKKRDSLCQVAILREPISPPKKLGYFSIYSLGKCLISIYQHCKELSKQKPSFVAKIDLSAVTEGASEGPLLGSLSPMKKPIGVGIPKLIKDGPGSDGHQSSGDEVVASKRETKRKLGEPIELGACAPKRRSTRVRSKRREHQNYLEMLGRYIPAWLQISENLEIADLSPLNKPKETVPASMKLEQQKSVSAVVDSTLKLSDVETVKEFLEKHQNNCGIINLLYEYVYFLATHYNWKWAIASFPTLRVYLDVYEILHPHLCYPSPFRSPGDADFSYMEQLAMIALCYVELYVDNAHRRAPQIGKKFTEFSGVSVSNPPKCFHECFAFVQMCCGLVGDETGKTAFALRISWCLARWRMILSDNGGATEALKRCKELFQTPLERTALPTNTERETEPLVIYLCNCAADQIISTGHVEEKIRSLEQSLSFDQIHQLFEDEEYDTVVDKLLPVLDQELGTITEVLIACSMQIRTASDQKLEVVKASMGMRLAIPDTFLPCVWVKFLIGSERVQHEETGLSLLLQSLLKLKRAQACLQCCVQALLELLLHYKMGNELWVAALRSTFCVVDSCLSEYREILTNTCDARLLKRLMICLLKTMDSVNDMADSPFFLCMPICMPWKTFYIIISSNWRAAETAAISEKEASPVEIMEVDQPPSISEPHSTLTVEPVASATEHTAVIVDSRPAVTDSVQAVQPTPSPRGVSVSTSTSRSSSPDEPGKLHPSLQFLKEAHDHLGSLGWCCKDEGCLLQASIATLRKELRMLTALPPKHREMLLLELEQCYYCLYGHPHKKAKARGLQEHSAEQVPFTWEAALMLIEYYQPSFLPSIDDTKSTHVTAELIALYKRITEVVPDIGQVLTMETLNSFIEGEMDTLPDPEVPHQHSSLISEVHYLLADDCLKSGDNHKALRYYALDLCYCLKRFDSWAGLALARSRKIVERLNMRDFKGGTEKYIQKQAGATVRCFEKAVALNSKHCYIIEKFGFFCYTVQSFVSQILSQPNLFTSQDIQSWAKGTRREMLLLAERCFQQALGLKGTKHAEPWIASLMLGKIGNKLRKPLATVLDHFQESAETLCKDGAAYPEYVELSAKGHAMEVIEVHYQLHSCALKYLLSESCPENELLIEDTLAQTQQLPLGRMGYPVLWEWVKMVVVEARGLSYVSQEFGVSGKFSKEISCQSTATSSEVVPSFTVTTTTTTSTIPKASVFPMPSSTPTTHNLPTALIPKPVAESIGNLQGVPQDSNRLLVAAQEPPLTTATSVMADHPKDILEIVTVEKMDTRGPLPQTLYLQPAEQKSEVSLPLIAASEYKIGTITESSASKPEPQAVVKPQSERLGVGGSAQSRSELTVNWELLQQCVYGIAVCVVRCPSFFKPLYRLATVLHKMGMDKLAKEILLGPLPQPLVQLQDKLQPLFVLKANIFTNMWQIPVDEINRPGNFSTHARRNLELLLRVLVAMKDTHSLIFLAQQLRNKPDAAKQYMRDNERLAMFKEAVKQCVTALSELSKDATTTSTDQLRKLLVETYTTRVMVSKVDGSGQTLTKTADDTALQFYKVFTSRVAQESNEEGIPGEAQLETAIRFCQAKLKSVTTPL